MPDRPTPHDREIAIEVLMKSKLVNKWLEGEYKAYGVDINTKEGQKFREQRGRELAAKLIK